jgi:hypothetical protein
MASAAARLFHTVVVLGAGLSACDPSRGASGEAVRVAEPTTASTAPAPATATAASVLAAATERDPAPSIADAAAPTVHASASGAGARLPAPRPRSSARGTPCPPGSERPFPPCYYIL